MIGLFAVVLVMLAFIRVKASGKLARMFEALLNSRMVKQRMREEHLLGSRHSVFLVLIFWLMLSLSFYFLAKDFNSETYSRLGVHLYWIIALVVLTVYLVKSIGVALIGVLFDKNYGLLEYLRNIFIFNHTSGLVLIPLNICIALAPTKIAIWVLYVAISVFFILLLARFGRGAQIAIENQAKSQYIFLYLCMLEILPTAVVGKQALEFII